MNNVVYYPKIEFDYDYLTKLVYTSLPIHGRPEHHRKVEHDEYMYNLRKKYPFFSSIYGVYRMTTGLPLHVDAGRQCTLNIPLSNCDTSQTVVYEPIDKSTVYDSSKVIHEISDRNNLVEIFRFSLNKPTLFNTTLPHEVVVKNNDERVSISWSISSDISFEECIRLFNGYEQDCQ
jgi:hypothetical protein